MGGGLTPLQKFSRCILLFQPTGKLSKDIFKIFDAMTANQLLMGYSMPKCAYFLNV